MYSGLLSSPIISLPDPPFSCPTGNCTWDPFATLAVGTQCVNFDSYIQMNCSPNQLNDSLITVDNCAFSAADPDDKYTENFLDGTGNHTLMKIESGNPVIFRQPTLTQFAPLDIGDKNGGLALVQWIKATDNVYRPAASSLLSYIQQNTTFEARRCLIYVNVRIISARVDGGSYSETVLDEIVYADNASATVFEEGPGLQFHLNGSAASHGVKGTLTLPQPGRTMIASEMVNEMFFDKLVNATQGAGTQGPEIARMLYTADNTTQSLEHMAHYLTVALRANDTVLLQEQTGNSSAIAPSQAVDGTVWVQEIFVRVHWEFLSLPALVLALTMVFLIITIVKSHPESVGLWKSNPLTLLFHIDNRSAHVDSPMTTSAELEKVAAKMQVDIVMNEDCHHVARVVDRVNV
ncbi:uncharacterized protein LTHEOB_11482 [Lasiodiplodia theobromae]|uniref:uncharacterized protein n=1 Tax=Lasiodiplodia theobromae TaxID=45133 RepID=UPI0015C3B4BD|nr:uncharacterized protein LTHEOB_11482 [Lasiodiplodia theobromae]KAF4537710.1 hypothetical protein LTHEOB_11482 [Lasiodiplodia theobromae]